MKRLYRDKSNEMIAGVCSGIANYLDVDPTVIRLVFVLFAFIGGGGLWIYIILSIIMPVRPGSDEGVVEAEKKTTAVKKIAEEKAPAAVKTPAKKTPEAKTEQKAKASAKKTTPEAKASTSTKKKVEKKQSARTEPKETLSEE